MQTNSRDGKFTIIASDDCKTGCRLMGPGENEDTKYDKEVDVYLHATKDVTLYDVAEAIHCDCFDSDSLGLHLLAKTLKCHVITTTGKSYHFTVPDAISSSEILERLTRQLKL